MKKYTSYILILITLVEIFGFINKTEAQVCWRDGVALLGQVGTVGKPKTKAICENMYPPGKWQEAGAAIPASPYGSNTTPQPPIKCTSPMIVVNNACVPPPPKAGDPCTMPSGDEGIYIALEAPFLGVACRFTPPTTPQGECWANQHNVTTGVEHVLKQQCVANHWCWRNPGDPLPPPPCGPTPPPPTTCTAPEVPQGGVCVLPPPQPTPPYHLLSPLPCSTDIGGIPNPDCTGSLLTDFNPGTAVGDNTALESYLNLMIKIFIGICGVLAVIMIVMGGVEYMTSELISSKEAGKERITHAILGLLLALGAWTLLNTINPNILKSDLNSLEIQQVKVDIGNDIPQTYDFATKKYKNGAVFGSPWGGTNPTLPYGVDVSPSGDCQTVGQPHCTSIKGLDTSALQPIQWGCKCQLTITGGTESWLHSATTSHKLGSSTVDIRSTSELDSYLSGGKPLVNFTRYPSPNGPLYETDGGNHWHIGP